MILSFSFHATSRVSRSLPLRWLHASAKRTLQPGPRRLKASRKATERPTKPSLKSAPAKRGDNSKKPAARDHEIQELKYPEQLLIYHAGTGKIVFLAFVRLTGMLLAIYGWFYIFPAHYFSPIASTWEGVAYGIGFMSPVVLSVYAMPPFITFVHLHLPVWARHSQERLLKYANSLPSTAQLDITTLKWIWSRVTRLRAGELSVSSGAPMIMRRTVPQEVLEAKTWYAYTPIKKFTVAGTSAKGLKEPEAWNGVLASIVRSWPKTMAGLAKNAK